MSGLVGNSPRHVLSCHGSYTTIVLFSVSPLHVSYHESNNILVNMKAELSLFCIRAPSSEFVSLSIPPSQILTAHAQPFRGARDLDFCMKVPLDSLLV